MTLTSCSQQLSSCGVGSEEQVLVGNRRAAEPLPACSVPPGWAVLAATGNYREFVLDAHEELMLPEIKNSCL